MALSELNAISPVDGRYSKITAPLTARFSEYALFKYRVLVEVEYFIALCELPLPQLKATDKSLFPALRNIYKEFSLQDAEQIKEIEKTTNHDIKAVEYFIKQKFEAFGLNGQKEFIHFGLTSQDINNTSIPLTIKDAVKNEILPVLESIIKQLEQYAHEWSSMPMLAKTHGQPASPTRLGKEIYVFAERLQKQLYVLKNIPFEAKFGGATGNFNAHHIAFPEINWIDFSNKFLSDLGLERQQTTTQIEHYDTLSSLLDCFKRINTILIDFNRDMWTYISMEYFKQKISGNEVGSSAMPHKVNPIDFENSEGNLGYANAIFEFLSSKLPVSRLQRDLTDSTVLRNIGVPFSHTLIAFHSLKKGLAKLEVNNDKINADLEDNWAVVAEAIQTVLRRESYPNPYETLKQAIQNFIGTLDVSEKIKSELLAITPQNYTGIFRLK
jgi:adenylosuccinate lyase